MTTALLIVDMQNFFLPMTTTCLRNIVKLTNHFRAYSLPQIFTQHGHTDDELRPPYRNQLVRKWGPDGSIHRGSKDWELIAEIASHVEPNPDAPSSTSASKEKYPVVQKNTYDAFINTNLEALLRERDVKRVVVCGVMTDCCCDTTARSAFNRGFETWLVEDACGSANKKQHEAGLRGFGYAFGEVLRAEEVMRRLGQPAGGNS